MDQTILRDLLDKYIVGTITADEKKHLAGLIEQPAYEAELANILTAELREHVYEGEENDEIRSLIQAQIKSKINSDGEVHQPAGERLHRMLPQRKFLAFPRAAAAAIVLILLTTVAYRFFITPTKEKEIAKAKHPYPMQNEILPGEDKAVLTLANGTLISLDSFQKGSLLRQGNTIIIRQGNGQLLYTGNKNPAGILSATLYNTLTTPRGGQYKLVLPDGSRVWLNAASSIHYPIAFAGSERTVELTGEAYFEVAKNRDMPFHVKVNDMEVTVLGTHFNINAYTDEKTINTTLLEGSVEVTQNGNSRRIQPGEQAVVGNGTHSIKVEAADLSSAVAWKNGSFEFKKNDIETIMRQVSRWYSVDVQYENKTSETFNASIRRNEPLPRLLHLLESTEHVHFETRGKTIVVKR